MLCDMTLSGSIVYGFNGEFTNVPELFHDGEDLFRKFTNSNEELVVCKLIMNNPHENVVKIYDIGDNYIDMELLDTNLNNLDTMETKEKMKKVKTHLQQLGIIYIDWKFGNTGISGDGQIKLFDFGSAGLLNRETNEWSLEPPLCCLYNQAINSGIRVPIDLDNYAFEIDDYAFDAGTPLPNKNNKNKYTHVNNTNDKQKKRIV